jgi:ATP-dependent protease ClpP protease subunit
MHKERASPSQWADMDRDFFMSATEAKAYGIFYFLGQ